MVRGPPIRSPSSGLRLDLIAQPFAGLAERLFHFLITLVEPSFYFLPGGFGRALELIELFAQLVRSLAHGPQFGFAFFFGCVGGSFHPARKLLHLPIEVGQFTAHFFNEFIPLRIGVFFGGLERFLRFDFRLFELRLARLSHLWFHTVEFWGRHVAAGLRNRGSIHGPLIGHRLVARRFATDRERRGRDERDGQFSAFHQVFTFHNRCL